MESQSLTPYIGLKAKLSRCFATDSILALLFLLFHLIYIVSKVFPVLQANLENAILIPCTGIESAANALTTELPRQLALSSQRALQSAISGIVKSSGETLAVGVHVLNLIVLHVLFRYQKLLLCFLDMLVQGFSCSFIIEFFFSKVH